MEFVSGGDLY